MYYPTFTLCGEIRIEELLVPGETTDAHCGGQWPHEYIEGIAACVRHLRHNQAALGRDYRSYSNIIISYLSLSPLRLCWRRSCHRVSTAHAAPDWSHCCVSIVTRSMWSQRAKRRQRRDVTFPSWDASFQSYSCTIYKDIILQTMYTNFKPNTHRYIFLMMMGWLDNNAEAIRPNSKTFAMVMPWKLVR